MIKALLPWIIYYMIARFSALPVIYDAFITLAIFIYLCHGDLRKGYVVSWLSPLFIMVIISNVLYFHWGAFQHYSTAIFYGSLSMIGWGSLLLRVPFTLQYSRANVPQDKWSHPLFIQINYILSLFWAIIFSMNLLTNLLLPSSDYLRLLSYSLTLVGMYMASLFPDWYRKRGRGLIVG